MSGAKQQLAEPLDKPNQRSQQLSKQKRIQRLDNNGSSDEDHYSPYALHSSQKVTNLSPGKANSLPPTDYLKQQTQAEPQSVPSQIDCPAHPAESHARLAKSLEPLAKKQTDLESRSEMMPVNTEHLFVEPPKLSMPELKCCLVKQKDEKMPLVEPDAFDQGEVFDTLARWQQELSLTNEKSAQLLNGANGHHHPHHNYELDYHSHPYHEVSPTFDHPASVAVEALNDHQARSQSNYHHNHHQHQATNARR